MIGIVGLAPDDDRILLAKCNWTSEPIGHELVERLETTVEAGGGQAITEWICGTC